jgi:hypothetical protein
MPALPVVPFRALVVQGADDEWVVLPGVPELGDRLRYILALVPLDQLVS